MRATRPPAVLRPSYYLAVVGLAVLATSLGCGRSGAKLPPANVPGGSETGAADSHLDPARLLEELAATYKQAKSYEDAGELHIAVTTTDGQKDASGAIPFSVAFERPNEIRVHSLEASLVADGKQIHASVNSLDKQVLLLPCPTKLTLRDVASDVMLVEAMQGAIGVELPQLSLLLADDPIREIAGGRAPTLLPDEEFDGQACHRVAIEGDQGTSVFWIASKSKLLVKYEFPSDAFAKEHSLAEASISAELKGAEVDAKIAAAAFEFDVPEGAKQLTRFLPPPPEPPEPPSPLLGKDVDDFTLVDYRGGTVSRESLRGKVVVLDLWATWCGWCFRGFPNLQKVYDEFKDNDKVVILAVNTDDVQVTDEQVREAFAKAELTIPIARDTQRAADKAFAVKGLPTMVILGPNGTVENYHIGYDANLAQTLPSEIEALLKGESLASAELEKYQKALAEYQQQKNEALEAEAAAAAK